MKDVLLQNEEQTKQEETKILNSVEKWNSLRCQRAEGLESKRPNWSPNEKKEQSLSETFNCIENSLQRAFAMSLEKLSDGNIETFKGNERQDWQ